MLTTDAINTIKTIQEAYFKTVKKTLADGSKVLNDKYQQVLESEGKGYWVDEYVGPTKPNGKGYVVMEKKVENGKTYLKATNFAGSEDYRTHDWKEIKED